MAADDAEKSEEPTGKKITDARNKGQVAQSQELSAFIMLVTAALMLMFVGGYMGEQIAQMMTNMFTIERANIYDPAFLLVVLKDGFKIAFNIVSPMMAVMIVASFITPLTMAGWLFTTDTLRPKFSKLNPISGLKKIFGTQSAINLFKALLKVLLVGAFVVYTLNAWIPELLLLSREPMHQAFAHMAHNVVLFFLILASSLILIAAIDVPFQKWSNHKKLKMSKQEVKDENKNAEGSPENKQRIRQAQHDATQRRMMNSVPDADVVITNPTHFAVALKYDEQQMGAPVVLAKGADLVAAQIRSRALSHDIPLVQIPPLARAIFHSTEIDQAIPAGLYLAVAKVLAYVFQLRQAGLGPKPPIPGNLQIPDELLK